MNVYDFDDTIYDGESCLDLFGYYLKRDPKLLLSLPRVLAAFAKYKLGKVTVEQMMSDYCPIVEAYFAKIPDMENDAVEFWNGHMKNIKAFYKEQQQEDDLIITASPEVHVREVCKRLGIKNLIGSVIDPETGKITRICMRSNKIKAFNELYPGGVIDNFYTDSYKNDKPLIDKATHAYIVKGDKITQIK